MEALSNLVESWLMVLIPVTTGLVEIVKRLLPASIALKWTPVLSIVIATAMSLLFIGVTREAAITGILVGLGASGLYSAVTNPTKKLGG